MSITPPNNELLIFTCINFYFSLEINFYQVGGSSCTTDKQGGRRSASFLWGLSGDTETDSREVRKIIRTHTHPTKGPSAVDVDIRALLVPSHLFSAKHRKKKKKKQFSNL
jgi:hypothetical protein